MRVKRFYGDYMPALLSKVKSELGGDAVIIQSRKVRRGGILGLFSPPRLEVIAAAESDGQKIAAGAERDHRLDQLRLIQNDSISRQVSEIKKMLEENMSTLLGGQARNAVRPVFPGCLEQVFQTLVGNGVREDTAREIVDRTMTATDRSLWQDMAAIRNDLLGIIADYFKDYTRDEGGNKERIALVGPTGVGKTTTLAKLAGIASVLEGKRVSLITIDTFRVAALDQLQAYADILSVPMDVAHTPKELKSLLDKHRDQDLVLIDTAGRSPFNKLQIAEIKGFLDVCPGLKTYLVLSATTNQSDLNGIIMSYGAFSISKIIFTKLDETQSYGVVLNTVTSFKKGLAYYTTGQNVPDDIEKPVPLQLAKLMLWEG
jgi:flagellar biosynthesis protein FlhF